MSFYMLLRFYAVSLALLLLPLASQAQQTFIQNEALANVGCPDMGPCAASVTETGALIASISGGGETLSVIPISNATNLNGVGAGAVGWTLIAADAVEAASTTTVLNLTSHVARVGDAIFSQTGTAANQKAWSIVSAVTTNTVTLANALPATPSVSDQVLIMRPVLIAASGAPSGQSGTALMANIDANYQNATSTGILKSADAAWAGAGEAGVMALAIMNQDESSLIITEGDYSPFAVASNGVVKVSVTNAGQKDGASGLIKNEDTAHATGDAGVASWGVRNDNGVTLTTTDLDYSPIALGSKGQVWTQLTVGGGGFSGLLSPVLQEDVAFSASNATMVAGAQAVSAIAQTVGTTGDVAPPSMDLGNRLVTTFAPADEMFSSCSSSITGTSRTAIKTAVPSNRIYVTSITCKNLSAVNSGMDFTDGAGAQLAAGHITAQTVNGSFDASFPVPLRGSVNTDFSVTMNTTATATVCCANGYTSTI